MCCLVLPVDETFDQRMKSTHTRSSDLQIARAMEEIVGKPANVREFLLSRVGFVPRDAFGWLYACRGLYQLKEYALTIEGLAHCIRHEKTAKEAQHLLAFSLLHTR